jgi:hypothetical protein
LFLCRFQRRGAHVRTFLGHDERVAGRFDRLHYGSGFQISRLTKRGERHLFGEGELLVAFQLVAAVAFLFSLLVVLRVL